MSEETGIGGVGLGAPFPPGLGFEEVCFDPVSLAPMVPITAEAVGEVEMQRVVLMRLVEPFCAQADAGIGALLEVFANQVHVDDSARDLWLFLRAVIEVCDVAVGFQREVAEVFGEGSFRDGLTGEAVGWEDACGDGVAAGVDVGPGLGVWLCDGG